MIQHNSLLMQLASRPPNKFRILLHNISKSPAKRSMDQRCNANTQNKARAGGLAVFIIITHNGARPNEMNSKNPSLPPTR